MDIKEAKERVLLLRESIIRYNKEYYVNNMPSISDYEYDMLMNELLSLEKQFPQLATADSPTQKVGSDLMSASSNKDNVFVKRQHKHPMLSLGNTYDKSQLLEFDARIRRSVTTPFNYVCELKYDGTAICLTYKNGKLVYALTRGDGQFGDDVTNNVRMIKSIPTTLKGTTFPNEFEIRGEIVLPFDNFKRLNQEREQEGEPLFANPRNAASGTLKLIQSQEVRRRGLDCVLYHLISEPMPADTHFKSIEDATKWGLPTSPYMKLCNNIQEVLEYIDYWDTRRQSLPFATDGVVIKVNNLPLQQELGFTAKTPRWATAWKFKPEQAATKLLSVDFQVGRTGAVTPVANLTPVLLSGTIVKRATLHNADQIKLLDIHYGDTLIVEKGGEIIPKVVGVDLKLREANAKPVEFITVCPQCGTPLKRDEYEAKHFCPNTKGCPPQLKGKVEHFMGRKAMNILGGTALIDALFAKNLIHSPADLYKLTKEQLSTLDNWGEKSTENLLASLKNSKGAPFHKVLFAIGIPMVGETTAKYLSAHFGSMKAIMEASQEELQQSAEIGDIISTTIRKFFDEAENLQLIEDLRQAGLCMEQNRPATLSNAPLTGLKIVISGNFSISREDMKSLLEENGAKLLSGVSANADYLLSGEKSGPAKMKKAEELGVKVIGEQQLYQMIAQNHTQTDTQTDTQTSTQTDTQTNAQTDTKIQKIETESINKQTSDNNSAIQLTLF